MNKKKISKKPEFTLDSLPQLKHSDESALYDSKSSEFFKNKKQVAEALLECLLENDTESFMEILDAFLCVNRTHIAQHTNLTRATITSAFSKRGNPTLKTIAKIVHEAASLQR